MRKLLIILLLAICGARACAQNDKQIKYADTQMDNYIAKYKNNETNTIFVCFYIEQNKITTIGEKMESINEMAYMNGYNWDVFLNYYLEKNHPGILKGMYSDPEAGTYIAYYEANPENNEKADELMEIIEDLVENESKIYKIVKEEGEHIRWD